MGCSPPDCLGGHLAFVLAFPFRNLASEASLKGNTKSQKSYFMCPPSITRLKLPCVMSGQRSEKLFFFFLIDLQNLKIKHFLMCVYTSKYNHFSLFKSLQPLIIDMTNPSRWVSLCGVLAGMWHCSKIEFQSHYYIHYQTHILGKCINLLISPSSKHRLNSTTNLLL